jgi:RNA polymerase sigma-70 factor (subfamily 1)
LLPRPALPHGRGPARPPPGGAPRPLRRGPGGPHGRRRALSDYLERRPLPFYPWLRRFAWEHLVKLHQRHLGARKRSARREEAQALALPDDSALELARRLADPGTSPSNRLVREELRDRVRAALAQLPEGDREVLVLRYLEQLSVAEIAAVLGASEGAVKMRRTRALERLCGLLGVRPGEGEP